MYYNIVCTLGYTIFVHYTICTMYNLFIIIIIIWGDAIWCLCQFFYFLLLILNNYIWCHFNPTTALWWIGIWWMGVLAVINCLKVHNEPRTD